MKKFKSYYVVWKLQTFRSIDFRYMLFKSYYVVWKRYEKPDNNSDRSRLNRTMQYGNLLAMSKNKRGSEFKSYYVVWKRKCRAQKYSFERRFKSYYVVWKLKYITMVETTTEGLNRTMQYGNHFYYSSLINLKYCLNRTMQYGNQRCSRRRLIT